MDHHTYAKSGSKKWSVEEKRLLVRKRIEAEELFAKYSTKQAEPWKKFKDIAKIGTFSDRALRKQWLNMVQRYRVQKSNMQTALLSKESIDELNEEWEFFGEIHAYMNQKTADLHSYALKEPNMQEHPLIQSQSQSQSQSQFNNLAIRGVENDHNFGTCNSELLMQPVEVKLEMDDSHDMQPDDQNLEEDSEEQPPPANKELQRRGNMQYHSSSISEMYSDLDSEESSQPSDPVAVEVSDLSEAESLMASPLPAKSASDIGEVNPIDQLPKTFETASCSMLLDDRPHVESSKWLGSASVTEQQSVPKSASRKRKALSEKEKYYKHRRRYEHRMEQRLGGLCKVAGQLLEHLVPGVNVAPLLMDIYNSVGDNCSSSCVEDDSDDDDDVPVEEVIDQQ